MYRVIDSIRNVLRKEGITGMSGINHCIAFIVSRLLDEEKCEKMGIPKRFAFDNIMTDENGNEIGDQELYDLFYNKKNKRCNCFMRILVNNLKFKNIKFKLKGIHNLKLIMKKLQELDVNNLSVKYDLIGTIYEIHLRSGSSNAMRDLGQYYTHRLVIDYMVKLCDIKMIDGMIEKIVDPTMGTGGFLTMAIKKLNSKYQNIDWTKNKDNIIGFDIDDNVKNMALLNIFLEIGEMCDNTIVKQDTLQNDMMFENGTILNKSKIILANEPMGIKGIKHASCCNRIKELKIRGTKAEPLFLQLFMEALDDNGRCAVIIPDGVLFNESNMHKNTRKYLIENFNLQKIISLDDKEFFLNTGVKTSILFFTKDGKKTEDVLFSKISITENEEIKEEEVIKVSYDDILEHNYSLFVNKYNVEEEEKIEGVEYKKLGDICIFKNGKQLNRKYFKNGPYKVYGGGKKQLGYHNEYNRNGCETIVCGTGSCGYVNICYEKYWASQCFTIETKEKNILINSYLYYYSKIILEKIFMSKKKGSTQQYIRASQFKDLKIPIPSLDIQNEIVKRLDVLSGNNKTLEKNIDEFKKIMKYYVHSHTLMCEKKEYKKLGDVCIFQKKKKKLKTSDAKQQGKYRFYSSSQTKVLYYDEYEFKNKHIIIGRGGKSSIHLDKEFCISHDDCYVISTKHLEYIYYFLLCNKYKLDNGFTGSTIKHISKSYIKDLKIPIPSLDIQNEIVEYCDNLNNMIENMESQLDKNNVLMKNILENYLNSQTINDETN